MQKTFRSSQTAGFLFTAVLGTFLHFLFELAGECSAAALFSAVNESIWEHMKLLYYPMVLFALYQYRAWGREVPGFWCVKGAGLALGLTLFPVIYYTYTGILGTSADWFNISIFFLAAGAAFFLEHRLLEDGAVCRVKNGWAVFLILLTGTLFVFFTFFPPEIPFFRDPITGTYGFQQ